MEVDFPYLTKGVGLDEVPLVVDMESVIDGVILQVRYITGDANGCHSGRSLMASLDPVASRVRDPWMRSDCSRFSVTLCSPCAMPWINSTIGGWRGPDR